MKTYPLILIALFFSLFAHAEDKKAVAKDYEGTLATGIMAIGGETTGNTLTTKDGVYEVDFTKDAALAKLADTLNGKKVVVTGELEVKAGVEIKERKIIVATAVKEVK